MLHPAPALRELTPDFAADPLGYAFKASLDISSKLSSAYTDLYNAPTADAETVALVLESLCRANEMVEKLRRVSV
ncbi:MAG: hypothetical protein H0U66_06235 [Gemmatimonadaceae bacterium]|nr:hypothetical protein [Gemmatimonadaceae bacterium]